MDENPSPSPFLSGRGPTGRGTPRKVAVRVMGEPGPFCLRLRPAPQLCSQDDQGPTTGRPGPKLQAVCVAGKARPHPAPCLLSRERVPCLKRACLPSQQISASEIETLLMRLPRMFKQEFTGVGATLEKRWKLCAFEGIKTA